MLKERISVDSWIKKSNIVNEASEAVEYEDEDEENYDPVSDLSTCSIKRLSRVW